MKRTFPNQKSISVGIICIFILFIMIAPEGGAWKTLSSDGVGEYHNVLGWNYNDYDNYKEGRSWAKDKLDDAWNHATNSYPGSSGHDNIGKIDQYKFVRYVWHSKQAQILIFLGHGFKDTTYTGIHLVGSQYIDGLDMEVDTAQGNWATGIPGTIFLFSSCYSAKSVTNSIAKSARVGGGRLAMGHEGKINLVFEKYMAKWFARKLSESCGNKIDSIPGKAYSAAKSEAPVYISYPGYKYHLWFNTMYNKPQKEYDFDDYGIVEKDANKVVGGQTSHNNDDGAFLYFNCNSYVEDNEIKVEYKRGSSDSWQTKGTYTIEKDTNRFGYDCYSEDIVIKFSDTECWAGYLQVRITPLVGKISIVNFRVHVTAE